MASIEHEILRYLYNNDNGEFLPINDILKQRFKISDNISDYKYPAQYLESYDHVIHLIEFLLDNHYIEMQELENGVPSFQHLGEVYNDKPVNLDTRIINARIAIEGRLIYLKAYLPTDKEKSDRDMHDSIISTNTFIRYTFWALIGTMFIQTIGIILSYCTNKQQAPQAQSPKVAPQPNQIKGQEKYGGDSLHIVKSAK